MNQKISIWKQKYRYSAILLRELVITEFKLRYQGSALGYLWSLLKPLFMFVILYLVFDKIFNAGATIPHYPVYLLLGILTWNYFTEVSTTGLSSIVSRGDLIRKINFPKYIIVLTGSFSALINLFINFIVLGLFMLLNDVDVGMRVVLMPLLLIELFIFSLGVAFLLSALFVRFRDINYIWEIFLQAAFYATPILYSVGFIVDKSQAVAKLVMLNPVAQLMQDARYLLISTETITIGNLYGNEWVRAIPVVFVLVFTACAAWYFKKQSPRFAEDI